jgi:hypothetical protein
MHKTVSSEGQRDNLIVSAGNGEKEIKAKKGIKEEK